ncbi:hypothetical protein HanLR1_Chr01g0020001 [Helianthus annuus]|nr:hypothetical protein HanHA89_Chr01g0021401 [Helianthus annuus]KAJ0783408.1 hypothetical protein HanLR1_Chr01g0020001 [Helianthus annuus]
MFIYYNLYLSFDWLQGFSILSMAFSCGSYLIHKPLIFHYKQKSSFSLDPNSLAPLIILLV